MCSLLNSSNHRSGGKRRRAVRLLVFEALPGHAEVDDREQHEDERLDETDEDDVERLPDPEQKRADDRMWNRSQKIEVIAGRRDQEDRDPAREDVPEQPKRQRHGLDRLLD